MAKIPQDEHFCLDRLTCTTRAEDSLVPTKISIEHRARGIQARALIPVIRLIVLLHCD